MDIEELGNGLELVVSQKINNKKDDNLCDEYDE